MSAILNQATYVRKPRYRVVANGTTILDASRGTITNQNNYQADRCSLTLITTKDSKTGFAWFEAQDGVTIEILVGFLADGETEDGDKSWPIVFSGKIDDYALHYSTNIIEIECRDFSATLQDAKTSETFSNNTSSEIATILAKRHGLIADVKTTSTAVGVYYKSEHDKISLGSFHRQTTEWHLLIYLAQQEGYDVWVTANTLHFKPPASESDKPYAVYAKYYDQAGILTSNVNDLRLSRDFTKSKDIKVIVKTWNSAQKTAHEYTAGGGSSGSSGKSKSKGDAGTSPQTYVYVLPGLSAQDAQAEANRRLAYLTKLERRVTYSEPGNLDYDARNLIYVSGTTSDGFYYIDEMTREFSFDGGFVQHVSAKNHSTKSQASVS